MQKDVELETQIDVIFSNVTLGQIEKTYNDILIKLIERYNNRIKELCRIL